MSPPAICPFEMWERALDIAAGEVGIREVGRNRGPRVEEYLRSVGLDPGNPWCAAFVHFCFAKAAYDLNAPNPCPRTGGVLKMWSRAPAHLRVQEPRKGAVFIHDAGGGMGHTGFVLDVLPGEGRMLAMIEGNTEDAGSREGDGVYQRVRSPSYANRGYLLLGFNLVEPGVG